MSIRRRLTTLALGTALAVGAVLATSSPALASHTTKWHTAYCGESYYELLYDNLGIVRGEASFTVGCITRYGDLKSYTIKGYVADWNPRDDFGVILQVRIGSAEFAALAGDYQATYFKFNETAYSAQFRS